MTRHTTEENQLNSQQPFLPQACTHKKAFATHVANANCIQNADLGVNIFALKFVLPFCAFFFSIGALMRLRDLAFYVPLQQQDFYNIELMFTFKLTSK